MTQVAQEPFELRISPPSLLSQTEELTALRTVCGRTPEAEDSRLYLATALVRFNSEASIAEAIELIRSRETSNPILLSLLTTALLGRGDGESTVGALESASRCVTLSENPRAKASALTDVARALIRLDRVEDGRAALHQASVRRVRSIICAPREGSADSTGSEIPDMHSSAVSCSRHRPSQVPMVNMSAWL